MTYCEWKNSASVPSVFAATDEQAIVLSANARSISRNRIMLLPDCDEEGEKGFKDLAWQLISTGIEVRRSILNDTTIQYHQPENLTPKEWAELCLAR